MSWKRTTLIVAAILAAGVLIPCYQRIAAKSTLSRLKKNLEARGEVFDPQKLLPKIPFKNGMPGLLQSADKCLQMQGELDLNTTRYVSPGRIIVCPNLTEPSIIAFKVQKGPRGAPAPSTRRVRLPRAHFLQQRTWEMVEADIASGKEAVDEALRSLEAEYFWTGVEIRPGKEVVLRHLGKLLSLASVLRRAMILDLHYDRSDEAIRKLKGLMRLLRTIEEEPFFESQMFRIKIAYVAFNSTWHALHSGRLNGSQLATLQKRWDEVDFLGPTEKVLSMERALTCKQFERARSSSEDALQILAFAAFNESKKDSADFSDSSLDVVKFAPVAAFSVISIPFWRFAWSYHDEASYHSAMQAALERYRKHANNRRGGSEIAELESVMDANARTASFYQQMCRDILRAPKQAWSAQTLRELTKAGIAICRFRQRHGHFPAALKDLTPEFLFELPRDYMDGAPLKYARNTDSFSLYSVGIDGVDNGGDPAPAGSIIRFSIFDAKDFVWPQPATLAEIEEYLSQPD